MKVGSVCLEMQHNDPNYKIVNVDNLTYASNYDFIKLLEKKENYSFYKGSINNLDLMRSLFKKYSFDSILNLAAESHVDNSINNPLSRIRHRKPSAQGRMCSQNPALKDLNMFIDPF